MTTHGGRFTVEYVIWRGMRVRCGSPKSPGYPRYGGRGIRVCERWSKFENFRDDMGLRPSPEHSLDRINNDGNYEPGNCRWATRSQQQRNRSRRPLLELDGIIKTQAEWAEEYGLRNRSLGRRLRSGVSLRDALTRPWPSDRLRPGAKLTPSCVAEIREQLKSGVTHKRIAERFGVTTSSISAIVTGKTWRAA